MNDLYLMWIKDKFSTTVINFNPGEIYLVGNSTKEHLYNQLNKLGRAKAVYFISLSEIKKYDHTEKGNFTKIVVRTGGIGDLVALSTIVNQIPGRVIFVTNKKYYPVLSYYKKEVLKKNIGEPIFTNVNFNKLNWLLNSHRLVDFEGTIEAGSKENWYDVFYEKLNMPNGERRPDLVIPDIEDEGYLLLCHRSSAPIRSITFEALYNIIIESKELEKYRPICVHQINLNREDMVFISKLPVGSVEVIKANDINEFIDDVACAGMVVSVDSAAVHIREAFQRPAIGIYNAFTAYSRTDGYMFTKSFDIKSDCKRQPCFLHQVVNGQFIERCPEALETESTAPCFGRLTPDLKDQVLDGITKAYEYYETSINH